jgi:TIR domain/SIR2-like domain
MSDQQQNAGDSSPFMEEEDWELLIAQIQEGGVIPVVGPDLIKVSLGDKSVTYERYIAQQLAQRPEYGLTDADFAPLGVTLEQATLNDVISVCVKKRPANWPIDIHVQVSRIVNSAQIPVPPALIQLAQITDFDLYVTATFDPMLEFALSRNGSPPATRTYQGSQDNDVEDLQKTQDEGRRFLYYLFGKATKGNFDFAVCDVEILRLLIKLHDANYRPKRLFDALRERHLLLLGVNFSDWLARFFLWLAKARANENVPNRALREYLADQHAGQDRPLVLFLEHFSDTTRVYGVDPERFVAELYRRWSAGPATSPTLQASKPSAEMPKHAAFLSYSRTDQAAVQNLYTQLQTLGIPAWYDAGLGAGDLWQDKIRTYIDNCLVFIPIVSLEALRREKAEFRAEWAQAVALDNEWFGTDRTGIVPIVVDEDDDILKAPKTLRGLPDAFTRAQMYHCPRGKAGQDLIDRLRGLLQKGPGSRG